MKILLKVKHAKTAFKQNLWIQFLLKFDLKKELKI